MEFLNVFPKKFNFFHLGHVEQHLYKKPITNPSLVIAFQFMGFETGTCFVIFEHPVPDTASGTKAVELANILVSKFATHLSESTGESIEISSPDIIDTKNSKYKYLLQQLENPILKNQSMGYTYFENKKKVLLNLTYIQTLRGNA